MNSIIIPVYKNEESIQELLMAIKSISDKCENSVQVVFVVDGSPDNSYQLLNSLLTSYSLNTKLVNLSRNFGSFSAIRVGLEVADGDYFAVMAADLQEPPELVIEMFKILQGDEADVVFGTRDAREDPFLSNIASNIFWFFYKKFIEKQMPAGGVDIFGCNTIFREHLLSLQESNTSLIAQLFWIGFRRRSIGYKRKIRKHGVSGWSFRKKMNYMMDSIFAFTDLPIRILSVLGFVGTIIFTLLGAITIVGKILNFIDIPGYAATIITVGFFGAINLLSIGIVGSYAWRTYENTKRRPLSIISSLKEFK